MKKLIYTRPDGGISIVTPGINTHTQNEKGEVVPVPESISEAEAIERAVNKLPDYAKNIYRLVDGSAIPFDRTFRNAWVECLVLGCKVDMPKAREIHRAHLRKLCVPRFAALDVDYIRADEVGDLVAKADIAAKKQVLRDVTSDPRIDGAATPEELKAVIPESLQ